MLTRFPWSSGTYEMKKKGFKDTIKHFKNDVMGDEISKDNLPEDFLSDDLVHFKSGIGSNVITSILDDTIVYCIEIQYWNVSEYRMPRYIFTLYVSRVFH